jgi:hypothetical protein
MKHFNLSILSLPHRFRPDTATFHEGPRAALAGGMAGMEILVLPVY